LDRAVLYEEAGRANRGEEFFEESAPENERLAALSLEAVGIGAKALELALEYAKTREQFGKPIGTYQAVSHQLANTYVEMELARHGARGDRGGADRRHRSAGARARRVARARQQRRRRGRGTARVPARGRIAPPARGERRRAAADDPALPARIACRARPRRQHGFDLGLERAAVPRRVRDVEVRF